MKTLIVKCPNCQAENNLGEKAAELYNSSMAFMLNRTCSKCGYVFDETDTHEADYSIKEAVTNHVRAKHDMKSATCLKIDCLGCTSEQCE